MRFWLLKRCLAGCLLAGLTQPALAQLRTNLALEPRANHGHPLALWNQRRASDAQVQFDSTVFRQGRGSLRLTLDEAEERPFIALSQLELTDANAWVFQ